MAFVGADRSNEANDNVKLGEWRCNLRVLTAQEAQFSYSTCVVTPS